MVIPEHYSAILYQHGLEQPITVTKRAIVWRQAGSMCGSDLSVDIGVAQKGEFTANLNKARCACDLVNLQQSKLMLIGQLSRQTGFSRDTIRYYEKIALIVLPKQARGKKYKDYPEELVHTLSAIRKYKELGFTLEEIRELLVLQSIKVLDIAKLLQVVELKITGIDEEIERLHAVKMKLAREQQMLLHRRTGRTIALPDMAIAA